MKKFIEQIKQSDRPTRKRWFIIFSVAGGLMVMIIWVIQFNIMFSGLFTDEEALASLDEGQGLFSEFSAAVSTSFGQIKDTTASAYDLIKDAVEQSNDLEIKAEEVLMEQ